MPRASDEDLDATAGECLLLTALLTALTLLRRRLISLRYCCMRAGELLLFWVGLARHSIDPDLEGRGRRVPRSDPLQRIRSRGRRKYKVKRTCVLSHFGWWHFSHFLAYLWLCFLSRKKSLVSNHKVYLC